MASLFAPGTKLVKAGGETVDASTLESKKLVGIYFSAHWCPPCRGFTPVLAQRYKEIVAAHPDFEIVFVSSDKDDGQFKEYLSEMPWLACPLGDDNSKTLKSTFGVTGIPMLVFVDGDGNVKTKDGRAVLQRAENGEAAYEALSG
eukprot:TRINITY_DN67517_c2_g15_i1.p1 TRINITY_DN67517_c2_g15~~TRINITY_DN67517_c2_g15_i1.p1  ORF type:complete len:145 (-),score=25.83 TRINITY_DN67517_c2_g15_i1:196-630(-)